MNTVSIFIVFPPMSMAKFLRALIVDKIVIFLDNKCHIIIANRTYLKYTKYLCIFLGILNFFFKNRLPISLIISCTVPKKQNQPQ